MNLESKEARIGIIIIILGLIFVLNNFEVINIGSFIWKLWPLLLIWWGYSHLRKRGKRSSGDSNFWVFGDRVESTTSPYVRHSSAFGDIRIKFDNPEIAGGSVSSVFGKVAIDLKAVSSVGGYGQLDLHAVFGDIIIRVPEQLAFEVRGNNIFGSMISPDGEKVSGHDYLSPGAAAASAKLVIRASQVFGDIELLR